MWWPCGGRHWDEGHFIASIPLRLFTFVRRFSSAWRILFRKPVGIPTYLENKRGVGAGFSKVKNPVKNYFEWFLALFDSILMNFNCLIFNLFNWILFILTLLWWILIADLDELFISFSFGFLLQRKASDKKKQLDTYQNPTHLLMLIFRSICDEST